MATPTSTQNPATPSSDTPKTPPSPLRCLMGSLISGGLAYALYLLTASIAQSFAAKPLHSNNVLVLNITVAVRTLVVGVSMLATGVFALVTIGLIALGIQLFIQQLSKHKAGNT